MSRASSTLEDHPLLKKILSNEASMDSLGVQPQSADFNENENPRVWYFKNDRRFALKHNIQMLMIKGAQPVGWTKLHFAVWKNDLSLVRSYVAYHQNIKPEVLLKRGRWGETALQLALRMQRAPEMIAELLRGAGAEAVNVDMEPYQFEDIESDELWYGLCYFPIHEAASYKIQSRAFEVVRLLLDNGAEVNQCERGDLTPLILAAEHGHREVLELLVNRGADVDYSDETLVLNTAVVAPREKDAIACLEYLLSLEKIDVNKRDHPLGRTALHVAVANYRGGVAELLLRSGADATIKDNAGESALDIVVNLPNDPNGFEVFDFMYPLLVRMLEKD